MAKFDEKIMAFVEAELKKNPAAKTSEIYEKAKAVSKAVADMTIRQFHARYPLQVKRLKGAAKKARAAAKAKTQTKRAAAKKAPKKKAAAKKATARTAAAKKAATSVRSAVSTAARTAAASTRRAAQTARRAVAAGSSGDGLATAENREAVRGVFLRFAADMAAAEQRKDLVRVMSNIDRYVDAIFRQIG